MSTVVFLGGGRITSAMLAGLRLGKTKLQLIVHDRNPAKLRDLKARYAVAVEADLKRAVRQADVLLVAVRPNSVHTLLGAVKNAIGRVNRPSLRRSLLAVSLAAGVPLSTLRKTAGPQLRWGRAMPSPLCRGGRGLTAVTFSRSLPAAGRKRVNNLFATFGQVVEIPESKFDALTVTFSPSHGYHALATLTQTAQAAGLDRKTALLGSAHALADGIVAWRDGELSLEALLEEAATPGGIAAATMAAMDASGYKRAVLRGVAAGLQRARKNASK
jgi:pyrroline-5-carboxylate reductase